MTQPEPIPDPAIVPPASPRPSAYKEGIKAAFRFLALIGVLPVLIVFWLNSCLIGRNRALESASQFLSLLPGLSGQFLRRAFLQQALAKCHPSALVEFGTLFSQAGAILDENVYVGPYCLLGLVHLERDVLIASGVQIPSGGKTHAFDDPERPIREQGGERRMVRIGAGAWIGARAIVLADVGRGTIVAAGAVVTKPLPENVIAAGVPARVIRSRFTASEITASEIADDADDVHPIDANAAVDAWIKARGGNLPEEKQKEFGDNLKAVFAKMHPNAIKIALEAIGDRVYFYEDFKAVTRAHQKRTGITRPKHTAGFIIHGDNGDVEIHLNGGKQDLASEYSTFNIYAHELGHAIDAGHQFSSEKKWRSAWKKDIVNGKMLLTRVARKDPSEAFADFYRFFLAQGEKITAENFPQCLKFLQSKNLI